MTLQKPLLGLAFMALATPSAHAASSQVCQGQTLQVATGQLLCSRTFYASGACDGQDRLAMLKDPDGAETQLIAPWEPVPITIVGVHLKVFSGAVTYAFAGNSYTPDVMHWLDERDTFYPQGTGFAFPAFGSKVHLDFHYSCLKDSFQAFYTVYYKIANDRPANADLH